MTLLADAPDIEDVVPATDLDALGDDELEMALRRILDRERAVAAAKLLLLDAARRRRCHARHGFRDTAAWVAALAGERPGAVQREVALAEQVAATPVVAAAMASGAVSKAQADVLVTGRALPVEVQERLVERADVVSVRELGRAVREAQYDHDLVPTDPLPACQLTQTDTGGTLSATVDAEGYEIIETALRTVVDQLGLPELPYEQRRAVALVSICRHHLEFNQNPVGERTGGHTHTMVHVGLETLLAKAGGSATLASGAVISGDIARRLACDADITRVITGPQSEILDIGRTSRNIPVPIAKAVIARDRHCTHPGCTAPHWLCEIHHILHWALGGTTDLANLRLLCWHHHQREHETTTHALHDRARHERAVAAIGVRQPGRAGWPARSRRG